MVKRLTDGQRHTLLRGLHSCPEAAFQHSHNLICIMAVLELVTPIRMSIEYDRLSGVAFFKKMFP
jgi:hypothetical protein